jgi:uncharacterized protein (TIGR04255 family)
LAGPVEPSANLAEYKTPPIVETVLGIEFDPPEGWTIAHFGLFWARVKTQFPDVSVQPPVVSPDLPQFPQMWADQVPVRCWFVNNATGRLLQLQADRLMHNWRKDPGSHLYPRYPQTREMFAEAWSEYLGFLEQNRLSRPTIRRCEITYVNHIERGRGWTELRDLPTILKFWRGTHELQFLPEPAAADMDVYFPMPGLKDRLHVQLRRAVRQPDGVDLLQLMLIARGVPETDTTDALLRWFDTAHEWIVRGFTDLTTSRMHEIWGRLR